MHSFCAPVSCFIPPKSLFLALIIMWCMHWNKIYFTANCLVHLYCSGNISMGVFSMILCIQSFAIITHVCKEDAACTGYYFYHNEDNIKDFPSSFFLQWLLYDSSRPTGTDNSIAQECSKYPFLMMWLMMIIQQLHQTSCHHLNLQNTHLA